MINKLVQEGSMQTIHRELREMLFCLIEGIKQWEKDFTKVPDNLYKGHMLFMKHKALADSNIPNNLFDLIKTIKKPSYEWGIPQLNSLFSSDAALIEPGYGLTIEADDFIEAYQSLDEADQSIMRKILVFCRVQQLDKEYRFIRTFLSKSENAVIDSFSLNQHLHFNLENSELKELVFECYEELPESINNYRKCPHCGWTLQFRDGKWSCNKENVCRFIESFESVSNFPYSESVKVYRMTSGIQRYILLPGIQEITFANRLEKQGYKVETYPEVDMYDIRVETQRDIIDLDIKDYQSASILSDYFNQLPINQLEKYHANSFIIIPSYRLKISPAFIDLVQSKLDKNVKEYIRIFSENQMMKRLKEEK